MDFSSVNCTASHPRCASFRERPCNVSPRRDFPCGCSDRVEDTNIYLHADHLPLTMAYVPFQHFSNTFDVCRAFQTGTIFPELCKPFCGRRCPCR